MIENQEMSIGLRSLPCGVPGTSAHAQQQAEGVVAERRRPISPPVGSRPPGDVV